MGEGFRDETDLTQAQKDFLSMRGNDDDTRAEARKNAFEHATFILEGNLAGTRTIRVSANPERNVTIPIAVNQNETTAGADDYSLSSPSLTFASGETSKSLTLSRQTTM